MTFRERLKKEHPDCVAGRYAGGCSGCPSDWGYEPESSPCRVGRDGDPDCTSCWGREMPNGAIETAAASAASAAEAVEKTADRVRHFSTGAVRDSAAGKGRFDLLPWGAIHALARHCERGAEHYGERNVDKGIDQHSLIDSAGRHLALYIQGDPEPHHLVAALWNIAWACEQEAKRPELIDLPERNKPGAGEAL